MVTWPWRPRPECAGKLIAFEGLDGVGKTTQARLLALALARVGCWVVLTREPSHGPYGRQLRELLQQPQAPLSPAAALELFVADRRHHVATVIRPALANNRLVITDRYYYSTLAYQGAAGLSLELIRQLHRQFAPPPDLVILLELPLAEVRLRLAQRQGSQTAAFENSAYLAQVQQVFQELTDSCLQRVEARGTPAEVHQRVWQLVRSRLGLPAAKTPAPGN